MSETSSNPEMEKQFGPQDQGLKESRSPIERLKGGGAADILDTKIDRRSFISRTGSLIGLGAAAAFLKHRQGTNEHTPPPPQSTAVPEVDEIPKKLENQIKYLALDETEKLGFSDVAQYFEAEFSRVAPSATNPEGKVIIRNEYKTLSDKAEFVNPNDLNDHGIVVVRVASPYDNANPEYSFVVDEPLPQAPNNTKRYYEWFALAVPTADPQQPLQYIDYKRNASEQPWFVGPNFVSHKSE